MYIRLTALAASLLVAATLTVPASQASAASAPQFEMRHGPQGTGNYKGKRDRHEKPGPQHEKKRKKPGWTHKR